MAVDAVISLPQGGGALKGIGDLFSADPQTGVGSFTIPIDVPSGRRGLQPALSLSYSSVSGNGPFGLGWDLGNPSVRRSVSHGIPSYDDLSDIFVVEGGEELVRISGTYPGTAIYRPRTEGAFSRIQHTHTPSDDYWVITSTGGTSTWFGTPRPDNSASGWTDSAVVANSRIASRPVFEWLPTRTTDPFGNEIRYLYDLRDAGQANGHSWNQPLLSEIVYGDYNTPDSTSFVFHVILNYEGRPDPVSDYSAGFERRVAIRCASIRVDSHTDLTRPMRQWELSYDSAPFNNASLLSGVQMRGFDEAGFAVAELPQLRLSYSAFDPANRQFVPVNGTQLPPAILHTVGVDLVDLFGSGLPDIMETGASLRYWRNLGGGKFDLPRTMLAGPTLNAGATLVDANGDGRVDLHIDGPISGVYPMKFRQGFSGSAFIPYQQAPTFSLSDPEVRLLDLDGDGVTDALRTGTKFEHYFNSPRQGWTRSRIVNRGPAATFPDISFSDPHVFVADMTGDGLSDIVQVQGNSVVYWPNLGRGDWGTRLTMLQAPQLPFGYEPARLLIGDLNGDGAADLVYIGDGQVLVWINQGGNSFSAPVSIAGTPPVAPTDILFLSDLNGSGVQSIVWSRPIAGAGSGGLLQLQLTGGSKPGLLNLIDGQIGAKTKIDYAASTAFYLADDKSPAMRWRTPLPFPLQVVTRVTVADAISGGTAVTQFRYRHGYWDGTEREFRGFAYVEQIDTETFDPSSFAPAAPLPPPGTDRQSPPLLSKTWFHIGPVGDEDAVWQELDWASEYWSGDAAQLQQTEGIDQFLEALSQSGGGNRDRRDALRTLAGVPLRSELYALDGSPLQDRPYTVTEFSYGLVEVEPATAPRKRVFFPHALAERSTQWQRGDDPMTQLSRRDYRDDSGNFDPFGRLRRQTVVGCPRGWRALSDAPPAPYLATLTETQYAAPTDAATYIHNRAARCTSYEIIGTAGLTLADVFALRPGQGDVVFRNQQLSYYDGNAFEGLPLGSIGVYGAPTRAEAFALDLATLDAAYGDDLPFYLRPDGSVDPSYPADFTNGLPALAGYRFNAGSGTPADPAGFFARTDCRRFDFQTPGELPRGLLLEAIGPLGTAEDTISREVVGYDAYGLVPVRGTDPAGLVTEAVPDYRVMQPAMVTDPNGTVSSFSYSPMGLLQTASVRGKNGEGNATRPSAILTYDFMAAANSTGKTTVQPISVKTTRYVHFDSDVEIPPDKRDETVSVIEYSDGFGRQLQTRSLSDQVRYGDPIFGGGDAILPLSGAASSDVAGMAADPASPDVCVSGWQRYDNKGKVIEAYEPFFSTGWDYAKPGDAELGRKTSTYYDPLGCVVRIVGADNSEQRTVYGYPAGTDLSDLDAFLPSPWESYVYDANDNAGRTHPSESGAYRYHWDTPSSAVIDVFGRAVEAVRRNRDSSPDGTILPIEEHRTASLYDIAGHLTAYTDELGRVSIRAVFDAMGSTLRSETLDGGVQLNFFDAAGSSVEERDSRGARRLFRYDSCTRPLHVWTTLGATEAFRLVQAFVYGDGGSRAQPPADRAANRALNRLGRLAERRDESGLLLADAYDFEGHGISFTRRVVADDELVGAIPGPDGWTVNAPRIDWSGTGPALDPEVYAISAAFDALDRTTLLTLPETVEQTRPQIAQTYNAGGSLSTVRLDQRTLVSQIAYDARGRRTFIAYGNGTLTRLAYDPRTGRVGRLRSETFAPVAPMSLHPTGTVLQDFAYDHDLIGNLLTLRDRSPGSGVPNSPLGKDALDRCFGYDALYRLRTASGREADDPAAPIWDPRPRSHDPTLTRAYTQLYTFDAVDNLVQLRHVADDASFTRGFSIESGHNRLGSLTIGGQSLVQMFDEAGNLVSESVSRRYLWDAANQLSCFADQVDTAEPTVCATYIYDAEGVRVKKLVRKQGGTLEITIYIGGVFERRRTVSVDGTTQTYDRLDITDNDCRIASLRIGTPFDGDPTPAMQFHLADHLGSSNAVLDETGAWIDKEEYTPFGETSFGSYAQKRYRFSGREKDQESGLNYQGSRYFSPWLCRWISRDPLDVGAGNSYGYATNPMNFSDPSGLAPQLTDANSHWSTGEAGTETKTTEIILTVGPDESLTLPMEGDPPSESPADGPQEAQSDNMQAAPAPAPEPPPAPKPFEPVKSDPEALRNAEGMGRIEWGDLKGFAKGLINGPMDMVGGPQIAVDPHHAGGELIGKEISKNLVYDALTLGAGKLIEKAPQILRAPVMMFVGNGAAGGGVLKSAARAGKLRKPAAVVAKAAADNSPRMTALVGKGVPLTKREVAAMRAASEVFKKTKSPQAAGTAFHEAMGASATGVDLQEVLLQTELKTHWMFWMEERHFTKATEQSLRYAKAFQESTGMTVTSRVIHYYWSETQFIKYITY